jgi:aryl carrier-like protein
MHPSNVVVANPFTVSGSAARANAVTDWLRSRIAQLIGLNAVDVNPTTPFRDLGLNSSLVATITEELSDRTNVPIDVTAMYENPTIEALAQFLLEQQDLHQAT